MANFAPVTSLVEAVSPESIDRYNLNTVSEDKDEVEKRLDWNRDRVSKALGLNVDQCIGSSHFDRKMTLGSKKYIFIDLSGTLHVEDSETPGAIHALQNLRTAGFNVLFVTNTTKESKASLHAKLTKIGFEIGIGELYTSLNATKQYVLQKELRPMLLVAAEAKEDFAGVDTTNPNAVVVGLASHHFNPKTIAEATKLLKMPDVHLIAVHKGRYYKEKYGNSLGPGPFVVALEFASNKTAVVLGKPDVDFYKKALEYVGCTDPNEVVMIGDDIRDDVIGSMRAGFTGIQVKTGKFCQTDLNKVLPHTPDFVAENFSDAVFLILKETASKMGISPKHCAITLAVHIAAERGLYGDYRP